MREYFIYKFTNLAHPNKKIYVGQTVNVKNRQRAHKRSALAGEEGCPLFYNAIRKYGYENFKCEIIEIVQSQNDADNREIFWIKTLDARNKNVGMNIALGGRGNCGGRRLECNTDTHKYCPRCKEIKLRNVDFPKNSAADDGLDSYCTMCKLQYNAEHRKKRWDLLSDEEKKIEKKYESIRGKTWYAENREERLKTCKIYDDSHKDVRKAWQMENVESIKEQRAEHYQENKDEKIEIARINRQNYKIENEKLTIQEIHNRKPIKNCPDCKKNLNSVNFKIELTNKDGLCSKCKLCKSIEVSNRRSKIKESNQKLTKNEIYARTPIKICGICKREMSSLNFHRDASCKDGLENRCKACKK